MAFVADNSVIVAWFVKSQATPYTWSILERAAAGEAIHVPLLWRPKFVNAMVVLERRRRLHARDVRSGPVCRPKDRRTTLEDVMSEIREHDRVVLTADLDGEKLAAGDVGTVVHAYEDGRTFEVEFFALDGESVAVVTLERVQVRPVAYREITHARRVA